MFRHFLPPGNLVEPRRPREGSRRTCPQKIVIVLITLPNEGRPFRARRGHCSKIVQIHLPESAEVKPVVSHPPVHHRTFRSSHLERRMWIHQRHHHRESFIRTAEHSHFSARLRNVLHQPV